MRFKYNTAIKPNPNQDGDFEDKLLKPGPGTFKVSKVFDSYKGEPLTNKEGEPKIRVSLILKDSNGDKGYATVEFTVNTGWKMKPFLESINFGHLYEDGDLDTDLIIGCVGSCVIMHEDYKGVPSNGIKYFTSPKPKAEKAIAPPPPPPAPKDDFDPSDVPF